jgi:hypothetical protein
MDKETKSLTSPTTLTGRSRARGSQFASPRPSLRRAKARMSCLTSARGRRRIFRLAARGLDHSSEPQPHGGGRSATVSNLLLGVLAEPARRPKRRAWDWLWDGTRSSGERRNWSRRFWPQCGACARASNRAKAFPARMARSDRPPENAIDGKTVWLPGIARRRNRSPPCDAPNPLRFRALMRRSSARPNIRPQSQWQMGCQMGLETPWGSPGADPTRGGRGAKIASTIGAPHSPARFSYPKHPDMHRHFVFFYFPFRRPKQ